jgi:hypothetical protein
VHNTKKHANQEAISLARLLEVLDDLVGARPLLGWHHHIDIAATESIKRLVADAGCVDAHTPKLVSPGKCRITVAEAAHGLPILEAWIANRDRRIIGSAPEEASHSHRVSLRRIPALGLRGRGQLLRLHATR